MTYLNDDQNSGPVQGAFWNPDLYRGDRRYVRCQSHPVAHMDCWHCLGDLHLSRPLVVQDAIQRLSDQVEFLLDVVAELTQGVRGVPESWTTASGESEAA